jgi:hypothetical protein
MVPAPINIFRDMALFAQKFMFKARLATGFVIGAARRSSIIGAL